MNPSADVLSDEEFIDTLERGKFALSAFPHESHLRMAWVYVRRFGPLVAADRAVSSIRSLSTAHGHPQRFHDTLTRAWVYVVAAAAAQTPAPDFGAFLAKNPQLLDRKLLLQYYTPTTLSSAEARDHWVAPDVKAIPAAPK